MPPFDLRLHQDPRDWYDLLQLAASFLGPIIAFVFGIWILRITKRIEHSQWRNQKLVEKRINVWDKLSPKLNDIYCYCKRVGAWKKHSPIEIVAMKRAIDKRVHVSRPYFSEDFFTSYEHFMGKCFATYQGHGIDARIRALASIYRDVHDNWQPEWDERFAEPCTETALDVAYNSLLIQLSQELTDSRS